MSEAVAEVQRVADAKTKTKDITKAAPTVAQMAQAIQVKDQISYTKAAEFLRDTLQPMIDQVHEAYDAIVKKAHEAHREAVATRARYLDPLESAKKVIAAGLGEYDLAQRRREEAERLARQKAIEEEQAELIEAAIEQAEAEGATPEQVKAILEEPLPMHRVVVPPAVQRAKGVTTRDLGYTAEVFDMKALARAVADGKQPANALQANPSFLSGIAKSHGKEVARYVPGVRAVPKQASVSIRRTR